ncbi:60S ribosomal protein eL13 [Lipomyces chichibuensis]|uniref:60S ribosomal protein eL13 n=1 Tax=Lipomyces chichibuensis TaxID=1546026 RepID=UPI0033432A01
MAIAKNYPILSNHFRKHWQTRVRVHFDQPGRKLRRRTARVKKAALVAPRPVDSLRPIVRAPTVRYNRRVRAGRGFTLEELKAAGIPRKFAKTVGIAVDHRRQNRSDVGLALNVDRLKEYKAKLILFPRKAGKPKTGDATVSEIAAATQVSTADLLPISLPAQDFEERIVTEEGKAFNAYATLRKARSDARLVGVREKRAKAKAEEAAEKKK